MIGRNIQADDRLIDYCLDKIGAYNKEKAISLQRSHISIFS